MKFDLSIFTSVILISSISQQGLADGPVISPSQMEWMDFYSPETLQVTEEIPANSSTSNASYAKLNSKQNTSASPEPSAENSSDGRITVEPRKSPPSKDIPEAIQETVIDLGLGMSDIGIVINTATKVWKILEKAKPVVNIKKFQANALPSSLTDWKEMSGWLPARSRTFLFSYRNAYGFEVIRIKYQIIYTAGGQFHGRGRYIGQVTVIPVEVNALIGHKADVTVSVDATYNLGTVQDPVAGMTLSVECLKSTMPFISNISHVFEIDGWGNLRRLQ